MTGNSSDLPARTVGDRGWPILVWILVAALCLPLVPGLLIAVEFGSVVLAGKLVPSAGDGSPVHHLLRGSIYLLLFGAGAWAVYRHARPERRRRYWIMLGLGAVFMISPLGMAFGFFCGADNDNAGLDLISRGPFENKS